MIHIYKEGKSEKTLLLLHGTGGDEHDLMNLAPFIDQDANILSVRGNVNENGLNRYFRRLQEGVFDIEDLEFRTHELHQFLVKASEQYGFDLKQVIAIGYSNGANIAGSLLFHIENSLSGAILLHPMVPRRDITIPNLNGVSVFIGAGENDPICPIEESTDLERLLNENGAAVEMYWHHFGHRLTQDELNAARIWYERTFK